MRRVGFTITFKDPDGTERDVSQQIEPRFPPDPAHEQRIARILSAELKVTAGFQDPPRHAAVTGRWIEFPKKATNFTDYFNIQNSQAVWFELTNLIMGVEGDLSLAKAYKALESSKEPSFDDDAAINESFYIHERKMSLLNKAVQDLIKVQDLVNRLLHESLGGDLVDATKPDWEKTQLTRKNVKKGLSSKLSAGTLSQADSDAIGEALEIPERVSKGNIAVTYRNRLAHHIRPSVDYSTFFSALQSRTAAEVRDAKGNLIGMNISVYTRPPIEYRFLDLHAAFSEYLDGIVTMLEKLSRVEILRR
jgi:hypothetical protein